jgi:hypothetical protein
MPRTTFDGRVGVLLGADYPFLDAIWTMIVFFAFVIWIWLIIMVLWDNFRRHDHSGWAKAGWTILIIFLPLIGVLAYLIARPATAEDYWSIGGNGGQPQQPPSTYSSADEIAKLQQLRDSGTISAEEFERAKQKALA